MASTAARTTPGCSSHGKCAASLDGLDPGTADERGGLDRRARWQRIVRAEQEQRREDRASAGLAPASGLEMGSDRRHRVGLVVERQLQAQRLRRQDVAVDVGI